MSGIVTTLGCVLCEMERRGDPPAILVYRDSRGEWRYVENPRAFGKSVKVAEVTAEEASASQVMTVVRDVVLPRDRECQVVW